MNQSGELLLMVSALVFGLRHGIDWDHIAAIADITGSQEKSSQALWLGTVYALGHGTVLTVLGLLAVWLGTSLPAWVDGVMQRIVGVTLVILGIYVAYSLWRDREHFRMRSRWMLLFDWAEIGYHKVMSKVAGVQDQAPSHPRSYGAASAYLVGIIHGVGAETPTQVLLFIAAAGAAGSTLGVILLLIFILGLLISNSAVTVMSTLGFIRARQSTPALMWLGAFAAVFSLGVGTMFLLGQSGILPTILGG